MAFSRNLHHDFVPNVEYDSPCRHEQVYFHFEMSTKPRSSSVPPEYLNILLSKTVTETDYESASFFTNENIVYTRYLQVADLLSSQWVLTIKRFRKRIALTPRGSIRLKVVRLKNGLFFESCASRDFIKISFIGIWKLRAGTNEVAGNSFLLLFFRSFLHLLLHRPF